jgi:uncharacterized protein (TIRG00374 family)
MKNVLAAVLKTLVTAVLFYFLFRKVNFSEFGETLRNARLNYLLAGFVLLWLGHYMCIFRWRMLMRPVMPLLSLTDLFSIYCIGLFFNLTFPTVVGGDVVKMYYAGRPSKRFAASFAATFLDRDAGMLAMMLIACVATLFHPISVPGIPVGLIIWGATVAFVLANLAIFTPSMHRMLTGFLNRFRLSRLAGRIDTISNAFQVMGRHPLVLINSLIISIVNQIVAISISWILALGLHIDVPLLYFLAFVPVVTLISMIPISLNGMGLREYAFLSLFGGIGVDREAAVALGLLSSVTIFISAIPGSVIYIFFRNRADAQQIAALESDLS